MPTYVYVCEECGTAQDIMHSMSSTPAIVCEKCGGDCHQDFAQSAKANPGGVIFKNPQGTSKMDSFDYRAHVNMEKAKMTRSQAAEVSHVGAQPYETSD